MWSWTSTATFSSDDPRMRAGTTARARSRSESSRKLNRAPASGPPQRAARTRSLPQGLVLLFLALLALATFWPVLGSEFISYDDGDYVFRNPPVLRGLTWAGVRWAFTTGHAANWHPLTWLSHMADISLFGRDPSGHHATNLLLHVANTLLLFLLFRSLTAAPWRSAWGAALFAVHPAHVESVAWVAERKDLLCAAFWLATTWTYVSWVRNRGGGRYLLVLLLFSAGLLSKPMIVSLPLVLLLLDYWPLGRLRKDGNLILEKAPLFVLAAASAVVTFLVQRAGGAVRSLETIPLWARVGNAVVACVRYLGMLFWPTHLAVFYPHPGTSLSAGTILGSALLLLFLSVAVVLLRRRAPFLFVGWSWFLVTLFPVIGVVQVGFQALADRYTYIPFIGLFMAIAWGIPAVASRWRHGRVMLRAAAAAALLTLTLAARAQARVWKNNETLFFHAIKNTKGNYLAYNNLGEHYNALGKPVEALRYLNEALRISPNKPEIRNNLGVSYFLLGRFEEALPEFVRALRLQPDNATVLNNVARTQFVRGEIADAIHLYERVLAAEPEWAGIHKRLALALLMEGETAAASAQLQSELALDPSDAESARLWKDIPVFERDRDDFSLGEFRRFLAKAHLDASVALNQRDKRSGAAAHLRQALELFPDFAEAHNELGTRLVNEGRLDEAETEFQEALRISPGLAQAHNNLGYVLFLKGHREAAIGQYGEALRLQPDFPLARKNLELALRGAGPETRNGDSASVIPPRR
jgi:tetratricopeptide (TPR) repeat protein